MILNTFKNNQWQNSQRVDNDMRQNFLELKVKKGMDILVLGNVKKLLNEEKYQKLDLLETEHFSTGVVLLRFKTSGRRGND